MRIRVRLFATLRERARRDAFELELEEGATAADALAAAGREEGLAEALASVHVVVARNREYVDGAERLADGDELALIPPVSGGDAARARISEERIDVEALRREVGDPRAGAVVVFTGVTRSVERLDYEAYAEMAVERIEAILSEVVAAHGLTGAAAEHRIGPVPLGEASVAVAVSAPHRDEAFAGAREAIDRIKVEAPIWKREVDGQRAAWVEGVAPERR